MPSLTRGRLDQLDCLENDPAVGPVVPAGVFQSKFRDLDVPVGWRETAFMPLASDIFCVLTIGAGQSGLDLGGSLYEDLAVSFTMRN